MLVFYILNRLNKCSCCSLPFLLRLTNTYFVEYEYNWLRSVLFLSQTMWSQEKIKHVCTMAHEKNKTIHPMLCYRKSNKLCKNKRNRFQARLGYPNGECASECSVYFSTFPGFGLSIRSQYRPEGQLTDNTACHRSLSRSRS